jgi:hypothetical protein
VSYRKVSILIPTRRRLTYLTRMLDSYYGSVENHDDSELVFRCDKDDLDSVRYLAEYDWPILVGPRREGYKSLPTFYNEMVGFATGDLFICGNDDMLFQTKGWPRLVIEEANKYPDGIFNIGVSTGLNDDKFPFSIVSRQLVQKLGKINDERLLFSDVFLLDVARRFNRAVRMNTVSFFHDWAGHTDDETRREANRHEFSQVFANAQGDWSEEYRRRHEEVVREAVLKIDSQGGFVASRALAEFERYQPTANGDGVWPPRATPLEWGRALSPTAIHYGRDETAALIRVLVESGIDRHKVAISSFGNGLPSLLWGHLFDEVVTVMEQSGVPEFARYGPQTLAYGQIDNTRFLYRLAEQVGSLNALVLDHVRYSCLISPYYLLRHSLTRPGVIIFLNRSAADTSAGVLRFLSDLRTGHLDGACHDIRDILPADGAGISYEIVRD